LAIRLAEWAKRESDNPIGQHLLKTLGKPVDKRVLNNTLTVKEPLDTKHNTADIP